MNKILITGYSGFVGTALCKAFQNTDFEILGWSRNENSNFYKDLNLITDLNFLNEFKINGIIHLAANSNVNDCEQNPNESYKTNVKASVLMAKYAAEKNIPFVFASSDQVFDGRKGNYKPSDVANPINEYGKQKRQAEIEILKVNPDAVVCRLPLMLGEHGGYEKAFVENLKAGKNQTLFTDEIRSVAQVENVAQKLIMALNFKGGIYHFGGPKAINRYEIGIMLAEKHQLDKNLLQKGLQSDVKMMAARPSDVSMVGSV